MVGVAGRSRACNTCRKRKKGCDLQRPICGQCQKAGIECAGYARQRLFVNSTMQNSGPKPSTPCEVAAVTLPDTLAHSAYEDKYLGLFWETYLPGSRALSAVAVRATLGGWTNTIQDLYLTEPVLRKALLAMCLGTIGRRDSEKWMTEQGLRLYVAALQDMSTSLVVPSKAKGDALLTASKLFSLYESMHGADDRDRAAQAKSWLAHCSGEIALVVARAPEQYISGHAHRLFVDGRLHLAISAMVARKKSFLSDVKWKTIPWRQHKKTLKDTLLDIFVDMPSLLEDFDAMNSINDPHEKEAERRRLMNRCWLLDKRLAEWYITIPPPRELGLPNLGNSDFIRAEDLTLTHIITLYWTACLVLYMAMPGIVGPDVPLPERADARIYCRNIIRTIPIFLHPAVGMFRVHLATFPMGVALKYLHAFVPNEMSAERKLLASYFSKPEAATMRKFVNSLELEGLGN